jgi:ribose transport system substrate-binding protein
MRAERPLSLVAVLAVALAAAGCGASGDDGSATAAGARTATAARAAAATDAPVGVEGRPSLAQLCGDGPVRLAYVDGFGGNSWRKTTLAEMRDEVARCDNVTLDYINAGGAQEKFVSSVNAVAAQGYDGLIVFDDFGPAVGPVLSRAHRSGVKVVPLIADPGGVAGVDYEVLVRDSQDATGRAFGSWIGRALQGSGKLIMLGGTPGNPSSPLVLGGYRAAAAAYPGLKLLSDKPVDTNWDPAQSQRVMSGLFAAHPQIDGILSDYGGGSVTGALRAYQAAGKPIPPIATGSSTNELVCLWHRLHKSNPGFQLLGIEGNSYQGRIAVRKAVAAVQGIDDPESLVFKRRVGIDTLRGVIPRCRPDLPPDADLWSTLSEAQLAKALG